MTQSVVRVKIFLELDILFDGRYIKDGIKVGGILGFKKLE